MYYPTVGQQSYVPYAPTPTYSGPYAAKSTTGTYGAMSFASASASASASSPFSSAPFTGTGSSPFNMNSFPFNVPPRTSSPLPMLPTYTPPQPSYIPQPQYFAPSYQLPQTQYQNNFNLSGITSPLPMLPTSPSSIGQTPLSLIYAPRTSYNPIYAPVLPQNPPAMDSGAGNISQLLTPLLSIISLLISKQAANPPVAIPQPPAPVEPTPEDNGIGGIGILILLLQLVSTMNQDPDNPDLPDLPILPTPPGINPGPGPGVWGDPHFTTKYGNFDFQGVAGFKNSDHPTYRLYDNGVTKINAEFAANATKDVSVINKLAAKVGNDTVKFDADSKKLTVNGKEVKPGDSVKLLHTGIKVDGREVAGSVSIDADGKVKLDVGDRIINFNTPGAWAGHGYIDVTTTNTQVGTQSTDAGNGKAYRQGGALGFIDGVTKDEFLKYTGGGKDAIEKLFNDTFHVGNLDDFNGWKGFGDSKTTYQYGVNANDVAGAS